MKYGTTADVCLSILWLARALFEYIGAGYQRKLWNIQNNGCDYPMAFIMWLIGIGKDGSISQ